MDLPLFPLNSVLFPGAALPLHIFEERYQHMIGRCLESDSTFGVLLIRSGSEVGGPAEPFEVGTTARIVRAQQLEEGRLNLVCVGEERFRLLRTVRDDPYLVGEVEILASTEGEGEAVAELVAKATALFAEYCRLYLAASNQWSRQVGVPGDPGELSDFVATRLGVDPRGKQRLLEELSVRRRLESEIETLSESIVRMTSQVAASRAKRWRTLGTMN